MSAALKMGFELLRPWGVISSVGVHNAEVSPEGSLAFSQSLHILMHRRSPGTGATGLLGSTSCRLANNFIGLVTKRMARTYVFRWADAQSDQYSLKLWKC